MVGNEARVYELITRHFLACVSKDAVGKETNVTIDINGEKVWSAVCNTILDLYQGGSSHLCILT